MEHEPGEVGNPARDPIIAILQEENEGQWTRKQCEEEGRMYMRDTAEGNNFPEIRGQGRLKERREVWEDPKEFYTRREAGGEALAPLHVPANLCVCAGSVCMWLCASVCVIFEFISVFSLHLSLAALALSYCTQTSSSRSEWGLVFFL